MLLKVTGAVFKRSIAVRCFIVQLINKVSSRHMIKFGHIHSFAATYWLVLFVAEKNQVCRPEVEYCMFSIQTYYSRHKIALVGPVQVAFLKLKTTQSKRLKKKHCILGGSESSPLFIY